MGQHKLPQETRALIVNPKRQKLVDAFHHLQQALECYADYLQQNRDREIGLAAVRCEESMHWLIASGNMPGQPPTEGS
jgi:hypothetical protein